MKKNAVLSAIAFLLAVFVFSCSSSDDISGDSGENTILTGKKAKYVNYDFQVEKNGVYQSQYGYGCDFEKFDPYKYDEFDEMKDLNGDGKIDCELKNLVDNFPEVKNHVETVYKHSEYELPWNAKANNSYYTFSFGKSKCNLVKRTCDLSFNKGDRLKTEKYDVQFKKENVKEYSEKSNLTITDYEFRFDSGKIVENFRLNDYKYSASFNDCNFDLREVKKDWVEDKKDMTYKIEGSSILIEGKDVTFSGTINQEEREIKLRQTYPSSSNMMVFDIEY